MSAAAGAARPRRGPAIYLDGPLIERLRVERRMSVRTLETAIGVAGGWYQSVVTGANHETIPLRFVVRLADELGVHVLDLLLDKPDSGVPAGADADEVPHLEADVRRLGSVLGDLPRQVQATTLARQLGWTVERLDYALAVLDRRLRGVGKKVIRGVAGVQIARELAAADPAVAEALADQLRQGALNVTHARILAKVARGEITRKVVTGGGLGNAQQTALGALINAGLVVPPDGRRKAAYALAEDVRASLLL